MKNILLVEPDYPTRFPPLGLLKIGTYHKQKGDNVKFVRGKIKDDTFWDRIYITTLFSFYHAKTIETILFYKIQANNNIKRIFIGGIYASLYPEIIYNITGIYPHVGLLDKPGILGNDEIIVDSLIPDYSLFQDIGYNYGLNDCYFGYATRGCPNRCSFCAVHRLEPEFVHYSNLLRYVSSIRNNFGEKQNLILMDNNVLASNDFVRIISDIKELGFFSGAKINGKKRFVDFNQGLDASRINDHKAKLLSSICIDPLRLAYDTVAEGNIYERAVRRLHKNGIMSISTYVLYNFEDTPGQLYQRLRHSIDLNEELALSIYSFPMRFTPLDQKNRKHVGPNWTAREIRGLQCILNVTKGLVSHKKDFFLRAFGNNTSEFKEILWMPDKYILNRSEHEKNGAQKWRKSFSSLSNSQFQEFARIVGNNNKDNIVNEYKSIKSLKIRQLMDAYIEN